MPAGPDGKPAAARESGTAKRLEPLSVPRFHKMPPTGLCDDGVAPVYSAMMKVAPCPRPGLSARIRPPCNSTSPSQIASPRPNPSNCRVTVAFPARRRRRCAAALRPQCPGRCPLPAPRSACPQGAFVPTWIMSSLGRELDRVLQASYRRLGRLRLASCRNRSRCRGLGRSANDSFARLAVSGRLLPRRSLTPQDILEPVADLAKKDSYCCSRRLLQQLGHTRAQIFPR
jgi:hypothetical protein